MTMRCLWLTHRRQYVDGGEEGEDEVERMGIAVVDEEEEEEEEVGEVEGRLALNCSTCCQARKVST